MIPATSRSAVIALIIGMALPAWGQQYLLYAPQPVASDTKASSLDGILVQEIEIQKGDTLYTLSRKFSGHGMYFPQILLFNSIKNPDLIYAGRTLKVPLSQKEARDPGRVGTKPTGASHKPEAAGVKRTPGKAEAEPAARKSAGTLPVTSPAAGLSLSDVKTGGTEKNRGRRLKRKSVVPARDNQPQGTTAVSSPPAAETAAGQKLFEAAATAYRQDDCRTALELLDRYLAAYSGAPRAADATLYKAECYLKLSVQ